MLKKHSQVFLTFLRLMDVMIALCSWMLAYALRFESGIFLPAPQPGVKHYFFVLPFIIVIWGIVFDLYKLYLPKRNVSLWEEFLFIFKACVTATIVLLSLSFFYREHMYSRLVFLLFFGIDLSLTVAWRALFRKFMRFVRSRGLNLKNVLIVGAGDTGLRVAQKLAENSWAGFNLVGWIDDYMPLGQEIFGKRVLGNIKTIRQCIADNKIDQIFITLPVRAYRRLLYLLEMLRAETVDVRIVPNIYQAMTLNASIEDFDGMPLINLSESPFHGWNRVIKRSLDILFSLIGIIVSLPIVLMISLLVKLTSPGPVFFKQKRYGMGGKYFYVYKIRSMYVADQDFADTRQAAKNDPRVTPVGRFIRRFSLDELPQLLNVLKGDMSIVGPRPHPLHLDEKNRNFLEAYMWRYKVKPGITGWAQVNGWRGETDTLEKMKQRIEHDIYYIEHWSFWFDAKIICLTLFKSFVHKNAY